MSGKNNQGGIKMVNPQKYSSEKNRQPSKNMLNNKRPQENNIKMAPPLKKDPLQRERTGAPPRQGGRPSNTYSQRQGGRPGNAQAPQRQGGRPSPMPPGRARKPPVKNASQTILGNFFKAKKPKAKKEAKVREPYSSFDFPFFTIILILLAFGIIMMFSASYATAFKLTGDSMYYVNRQLIFAVIGLVTMIALSFFDYHVFMNKQIMRIMIVVSVGLMFAVMLIGTARSGAGRWLEFGEITIQPSEILKFVVIAFFALLAQKHDENIKDPKQGFLPFAITLFVAAGLVLVQRHLSATIIIFLIGLVMMFVAGVRVRHLLLMLIGLTIILAIAIPIMSALGMDYVGDRIAGFLDPEADIQNSTFQTYQSLVTIGSGGMFGLGFGNSRQKYSYLPESRNDFIFSIICEELGFVGAMAVILLFVIFIFRGFYIATRARDKFGMMLAVGITFQIGLQALLNIAVVTNSIPNTGISLPFFSSGGTALIMQLAEVGILLNISRKAAID